MATEPGIDIDFGSIPFGIAEPPTDSDQESSASSLEVLSLNDFLIVSEDIPSALVGTADNAFCPQGGLVIVGGLGGSGKTTWTLDAVAHFASGSDWNAQLVERPLSILLIENEGPRAFFREKLRSKVNAWEGGSFNGNVHVLHSPWGEFDFREPRHREELRATCDHLQIDLVVGDPLTNLGMRGGGTPDDTRAFVDLLRKCGLHDPDSPIAFWILHHLNKSTSKNVLQTLSGAWDNWADTIVLLTSDHQSKTSIASWGKVRYGSIPWGERRTSFTWTETYGYQRKIKTDTQKLSETLLAVEWIESYLEERPGEPQGKVLEAFKESGGVRERGREAIALMMGQEDGQHPGDFGHLKEAFVELILDFSPEILRKSISGVVRGPGKSPNGVYLFLASDRNLRSQTVLIESDHAETKADLAPDQNLRTETDQFRKSASTDLEPPADRVLAELSYSPLGEGSSVRKLDSMADETGGDSDGDIPF